MFNGLSAFPLTPADDSGRVDTKALQRFLERLVAAQVDSIGLLGSTGAYVYLSRQERRRAVEAAAECVAGRVPVIVGVGTLRTDDAQALAADAKASGADGLLLAPVSYTPLTEEEVYRHFIAVAGVSDLPLCIYNNPGTTKFAFSHDLIVRLADVPNIKAVKMPLPGNGDAGAELDALRSRVPSDFAIGYSGDWGACDALLAGCDAWYSVVAGLLPMPAMRLTRAAQAGDKAEAQRLNEAFSELWSLFKELSSLRVMYALSDHLGLSSALPPKPLLPISKGDRIRVEHALERLGSLE
ncbi:dihydrodipicolinate synthase family protein [Corticibacterium sp. UT-5YL-CI-8]|nr:dihydrodipicolinate synthase family protein [Tianweitania sp. UT-5YL-CI-8]